MSGGPRVRARWSLTAPHKPTRCLDCLSTAKDFVPCTYDERTLVQIFNKLYNYARTLTQASRKRSLTKISHDQADDIEMLTSSPSPTFNASTSGTISPRHSIYSQSSSQNGSYIYTKPTSPRSFIRRPPPVAFPRQSPPIAPPRPSFSSSSRSSKTTVDAGTQYTPSISPISSTQTLGKRRMPSAPSSPAIVPQMPQKRTAAASPPPTASPQESASAAKAKSKPVDTASPTASTSTNSTSSKRARGPTPLPKSMPAQYETCDVRDLVTIISGMLMELIRLNDEIPLKDGGLTRFHSRAPPGISVPDYLLRLTTHATLSPPILLSMVYYIDRLCALYPAFNISSLTVHRFLIASATVASKGLSDSFWTNNTYAKVGGVSLKELALLELEFLWRVEWRIVPRPEVLCDYYRSLVERSEGYKIADDDEKVRKRDRRERRRRRKEAGSTHGSESSSGSSTSGSEAGSAKVIKAGSGDGQAEAQT